jgi:hypothetical protein
MRNYVKTWRLLRLTGFEEFFCKGVVFFGDEDFDLPQAVHRKRMYGLDHQSFEQTGDPMTLKEAFDDLRFGGSPGFMDLLELGFRIVRPFMLFLVRHTLKFP